MPWTRKGQLETVANPQTWPESEIPQTAEKRRYRLLYQRGQLSVGERLYQAQTGVSREDKDPKALNCTIDDR